MIRLLKRCAGCLACILLALNLCAQKNITRLEYYIDADPGFGKATAASITPGTNLANLLIKINPAAVGNGLHILGLRALNASGNWSQDNKWIFAVPYASDTTKPAVNITRVEYYIDADPGFGQATALFVTTGTNLSGIALNIPLNAGLSYGVHVLGIRAQNANGTWGHDNKWILARPYASDTSKPAVALARMEYFIDKDPGYGKAVPVVLDSNTINLSSLNIAVDVSGLATGSHSMLIRAENINGNWGYVYQGAFTVPATVAAPGITINRLLHKASYCARDTLGFSYDAVGTFNADNKFTLQLSDTAGDFNTPVTVGSFAATGDGTIKMALPGHVTTSGKYRLRLVSSSPVVTGVAAIDTLTIYDAPALTNPSKFAICSGAAAIINLTATTTPGTNTFVWALGKTTGSVTGAAAGSGPTISQTLTNPGNTGADSVIYNITATSAVGCVSVITPDTAVVNAIPVANSASTLAICSGTATNIILAASTPGANTFTWTLGKTTGGVTGAAAASGRAIAQTLGNPSNNAADTVVYSVIATSLAGCVSAAVPDTVMVNALPAVTATMAKSSICSGAATNITLTASTSSGANTFDWVVGKTTGGVTGAASGSGATIAQTLVNPGTAATDSVVYNITATSAAGCASAVKLDTITVGALVTPSVSINANHPSPVCAGVSITFTATAVNGGPTPVYQWYKDNVAVGTNSSSYAAGALNNGDSVWCVVTSNAACAAATSAKSNVSHFVVNPIVTPSVTITASAASPVCAGTNVTFTATASGGGTVPAYQWYKNNIAVGTNSPGYSVGTLNNGDSVWCVITSNAACLTATTAKSNVMHYTVNPILIPSTSITASAASPVCAGTSVTFTATAVNGGTTPVYQWYKDNTAVGTNSNTYSTNGLNTGDSIWCIVTNNAICATASTAKSNVIHYVVNPLITPSVAITANTASPVCTGTPVTFTASVVNGGATPVYQWYKDNIAVGTNSSSYAAGALNNGDSVWCIVTSNAACLAAATAKSNVMHYAVTSSITPSVNITTNAPSPVCAGTNVTFTATASGGGTVPVYQWYKDNVAVGTNSGTYSGTLANGDSVWCIVTSNSACVTMATAKSNVLYYVVNALVTPSVTITASAASPVCAGTSVTFTATAVNGGTTPAYQWYKDGVAAGTNSNTYAAGALSNGDSVWCIVTSNAACLAATMAKSNVAHFSVTALITPTVSITASAASPVCTGTPVTFTASVVNGGATPVYQWYKDNIAVGTNSSSYAAGALNNGDSVWCVVTSNTACLAVATAKSNVMHYAVTTSITPSINITANTPSTVCAGTSVTFTATAANGGTTPVYQWYKDNIAVGTNSNTYATALSNGDSVWCVVTSNSACVTTASVKSNVLYYVVNALVTPSVTITASAASPICAGTSVSFTATVVNGGTVPVYQWYKDNIAVGTNSNTYAAGALSNGDSIWCIVTSNAACVTGITAESGKLKFTVNAFATPSVTVAANTSATICARVKVTFTATAANGGPAPVYQWYKDNTAVGTNASPYIDSTLKNNDSVWCVLTSTAACVTTATASSSHLRFTVNALIAPSVSITSNTTNTICAGSKVLFTATPINGGVTPAYQWYKDNAAVGANAATYTDSTLKNGDSVWCLLTSNAVCVTPAAATSNKLKFTVNQLVTPSVTISANAASPINAGTKVTFTATVTNGGLTPAYQWYKDNIAVGTNAATYTDSTLKNGDSVWCVVTSNALCTTAVGATSNKLKFAVNTAATVSIASNATSPICAGTKITFAATVVNGGTAPVYQWYKDANKVGTNAATYTDTTLKNGDSVWCFITSNAPLAVPDTATSNKLKFTVNALVTPAVTIGASSASTICAGTSVTFTATAVNGGTAPAYQWYKDNVAAATGASYSTTALANKDSVWCTLTSNAACPSVTVVRSNTSKFTVNALPAVSVSGSACVGSLLTLTSNTVLSEIIWQRNDTTVATHKDSTFYPANGLTVAGYYGAGYAANQLNYPAGIWLDASKNIYIADELNGRIQKWAPGTAYGTTVAGFGQSSSTLLNDPTGVYIDASGNMYIADQGNNRVQEWKAGVDSGITVAGGNGSGSAANQLNGPSAVFVDASHNVYVADEFNNRVQKWMPGATSGVTVAGGSCCGGAANLYYPTGIYVDASSNIYIADLENNRIQKWAPGATSGVTVAGGNGNGYAANQLSAPSGVYLDAANNIYVANAGYGSIQKWAPGATSGVTVAGGNGFGSAANQLYEPSAVYVDASGNIYVCDQYNSRVQEFIYKDSITNTLTAGSTGTYTALATAKNGCTASTAGYVVNPLIKPSVTIAANTSTSISAGTKVTFSAASVNGGAAPAYKWYKDNTGVGTTAASYIDSTLKNNDSVWCVLTSDATCLATATAKSNVLKFAVSATDGLPDYKLPAGANKRVLLYPNPSTTAAVLQVAGYSNKYAVIVYDMSGKPVWKTESAGDANITLPAHNLASGVYLVRIISDADEKTIKWIIGR